MATATMRLHPVLHALRVCGFGSADRLAGFLAQPAAEVEQALRELEQAGLARFRDGRVSGWLLTPQARDVHAEQARRELADASWASDVEACYQEFLGLNVNLKQTCTEWQIRPGAAGSESTPNDHADPGYDAEVIGRLGELHERSIPMLDRLAAALPRFRPYRARLEDALARLHSGDTAAFARPMSGSYHCAWMELHEDLLTTLDRQRGEADGH